MENRNQGSSLSGNAFIAVGSTFLVAGLVIGALNALVHPSDAKLANSITEFALAKIMAGGVTLAATYASRKYRNRNQRQPSALVSLGLNA